MIQCTDLAILNHSSDLLHLPLLLLEYDSLGRVFFHVNRLQCVHQRFDCRRLPCSWRSNTHDAMPTLHRTVDAEDGLYQLVVYLEVILLELLLDHFLQFVAVGEVRVRDLGEDILADVLEYLDVDEEKLR